MPKCSNIANQIQVSQMRASGWLAVVLIWFLLFNYFSLVAQDKPAQIAVLSKAGKNEIRLRWAPTTATSWLYLNKYGYIVERITIVKDNKLLQTPVGKTLTPNPIKPLPLDQWQPLVETNDFATVAAQAIYGETFEINESISTDIIQLFNKSKEQEQRYSFALFAADQAYLVARYAGLAYTDSTVLPNEKYLYRIISNVPAEIAEITTGTAYAGLEDYAPLPAIQNVKVEFGDKVALIYWDIGSYEGLYNSFLIEKSTDGGKTWASLNPMPVVFAFQSEAADKRQGFEVDSLEKNNRPYYYRVFGIDAFGEKSPPSKVISGSGFARVATPPNITDWRLTNGNVVLSWEHQKSSSLTGYRIERSSKETGPYITIQEVAASATTFTDKHPASVGYYRVTAFNSHSYKSSLPVLVQLEDSIPPLPPTDIQGHIDSTGLVTLQWRPNHEKDLVGYRVYRSNFKKAEFSQITRHLHSDTIFTDTINLKILNQYIYYQITAVDYRYNESSKSTILKLARPDILPPANPLLTLVQSNDQGIKLSFSGSSSTDVHHYEIYRKTPTETNWLYMATLPPADSGSWVDKNVQANTLYSYTIVAVDSAGNESNPSPVVSGSHIKTISRQTPERLQIKPDRNNNTLTVTWQFTGDAYQFKIYRSEEDAPLSIYGNIAGDQRGFKDHNVKPNKKYKYGIQAVMPNGLSSKLVFIEYKY